jgi:type IV secretory pathway TrbD component
MTDYITTALLFIAACLGVGLIWLMKQPLPRVPDRTELDSDDPRITRIYQRNKEPMEF